MSCAICRGLFSSRSFLEAFGEGELADLFRHLFVAALGTNGLPSGIDPLREEAEDPAAFRAGKFVNRHNPYTIYDLRFTRHKKIRRTGARGHLDAVLAE